MKCLEGGGFIGVAVIPPALCLGMRLWLRVCPVLRGLVEPCRLTRLSRHGGLGRHPYRRR